MIGGDDKMTGEFLEIGIPLSIGSMVSTIGPMSQSAPRAEPDLTLHAQRQRKAQLKAEIGIHHRAGRLAEVERLLNQVLELDPKDTQSLFNLGILAREADELARAERFFKRVIEHDPDYVDVYQALGEMHYEARHLLTAIQFYQQGIQNSPNRLPLLQHLVKALMTQRSPGRVAVVARRILDIDDQDRDGLCYLVWAMLAQNADPAEARGLVDRIRQHHPDLPMGYCLGTIVAERQGLMEDAREFGRAMDLLAQNNWDDARRTADLFISLGMPQRGAHYVRLFLARHPEDAEAQRHLATVLFQDGDFIAGQEVLDQILIEETGNLSLKMIRALNAFRLNNLERFALDHHTRWARSGAEEAWNLPVPEWNGAPIGAGKLAVYCEQGVGDHVMYATCFPGLKKLARDVVIETVKRMAPLLQRSFPDMQVMVRTELPADWSTESVTAKVAAGDLPLLLSKDLSRLPGKAGFLIADPALLTKLRDRYRAMFPGKRLIGISWRSGNRDSAAIRSLELPYWKKLFDLPDCAFISLQYGEIARDIEELRKQIGDRVYCDREINPMGMMDPFTAQVAAMDLVISVDNSTIHFAGGLGKPCWAMLPLNSDWRWQVDRTDNFWYDSLELFRQDKETGWDGIVDRIVERLGRLDEADLRAADIRAWHRAAKTLLAADRLGEAEQYCRLLLAEGEHKPLALQGIARSALAAGQPQDGVAILMRAVELAPDDPEVKADLILAMSAAGEGDRALVLARQLTREFPENAAASMARGRVIASLGRPDEATDHFARALRQDPQHIPSRLALAGLQAAQCEWDLARMNYRRVLDLQRGNTLAHTALGEIDLRLENWSEGWRGFAWRFQTWPGALPPHLASLDPERQPKRWQRGSLKKTRIFLRAERNLAEQVLFAGLLAEIQKETREIAMECDPRLLPLLQSSFPGIHVRPTGQTTEADLEGNRIQTSASLGDLAAHFRPDAAAFPTRGRPYLRADAARVAELRAEYHACFPGRKLIGLSWRPIRDDEREGQTLGDWLDLVDHPELGIVALHPLPAEADLAQFAETGRDLISDRRIRAETDFSDYAAQIAACDAVVAVEDLTAQLAAALGVRVLKPVRDADRWWWGTGEGASPWHPNLERVKIANHGMEAVLARLLKPESGTSRQARG